MASVNVTNADTAPRSYLMNGWNDCFQVEMGGGFSIGAILGKAMSEQMIKQPIETIVFGEKETSSGYFDMDMLEGIGNDFTEVEQSRHSATAKTADRTSLLRTAARDTCASARCSHLRISGQWRTAFATRCREWSAANGRSREVISRPHGSGGNETYFSSRSEPPHVGCYSFERRSCYKRIVAGCSNLPASS